MQQENVNPMPPTDRCNGVYFILLLHGIGILLPWNMFITARSYFVDYKMSKNYTGEDSQYTTHFLSYVSFSSQVPIIIFNWINVFINISGSFTPRILFSIFVEVVLFIVTIIFAITDTSRWSDGFFWCTIVTIIILNIANGIYENTLFGIGAKLPFKYSGAIILGCNISGTLVSLVDLITKIVSPNVQTAAIYFFASALLVLVLCLISYFALPFIKFYRYYSLLSNKKTTEETDESTVKKIPYWSIFQQAFSQLFNVFFIFFITLTVFPGILADIKKSDSNFIIPEKYYQNIMCFLTFNIAAVLGSLSSNWIKWPSPKTLLIPVLLRVFFIPFFFFCNYKPVNKVRKVPVLIPNDWVYWIAGIFLGFTSGFLSSKAVMYITRSVDSIYGSISGMLGAAVIVTGIFIGVLFSMIFPFLVET